MSPYGIYMPFRLHVTLGDCAAMIRVAELVKQYEESFVPPNQIPVGAVEKLSLTPPPKIEKVC